MHYTDTVNDNVFSFLKQNNKITGVEIRSFL